MRDPQISRHAAAHTASALVLLFGFYVLFAGNGQPAELIAGAIVAGLVAAFEAALRSNSDEPMNLSLSALRPVVPAVGKLVRDIFRLSGGLLAAGFRPPPTGDFRRIRFPADAVTTSAAGRAIAIAATSLPPNAYVVASTPGDGKFTVHQLLPDTEKGEG